MTTERHDKSEQIFSKLPDYGYSKRVTNAIYRWYHPHYKATKIYNFKISN